MRLPLIIKLIMASVCAAVLTLPAHASNVQNCLYTAEVLKNSSTMTMALIKIDEPHSFFERSKLVISVRFLAMAAASQTDANCVLPDPIEQVVTFSTPPMISVQKGQAIDILLTREYDDKRDSVLTEHFYLSMPN